MLRNKQLVRLELVAAAWWMVIVVATLLLQTYCGHSFIDSLYEVISAVTNSGFSVVSDPSNFEKHIKCALMLFGKANVIAALWHVGHVLKHHK